MRFRYLIPLVLLAVGAAHAAPIDGTFNYQGRLTSGGAPITGTADVRFSLWDDPVGGAQVGATVDVLGASVSDGLFNADLDFGVDALNGDERWLQIEVRSPAGSGGYVNLGRQAVLGAPYAIQTRGIFVDDALNVGVGTTAPAADLHVGDTSPSLLVQDASGASLSGIALSGTGAPLLEAYHDSDGNVSARLVNGSRGGLWQAMDPLGGGDGGTVGTFGTGSAGDGFIQLYSAEFSTPTVRLYADKNNNSGDDNESAVLELSSRGSAGEGGRLSVRDNSGNETISLIGGGTGSAGSITMYDNSGAPIGDLVETAGGGRIRLYDSTTGMSYFDMQLDTSPGGGGAMTVARNNAGDAGFEINGNYGDTQSTALLLHGTSSMGFYTSRTGKDSVVLPADAIEAVEVLDEPGVASETSNGSVPLTGAVDTVLSRTITCPTDGYCLVIGTGQCNVVHTNGTTTSANFGVSSVSTTFAANQDVLLQYSSVLPSAVYSVPVTVHGLFSVGAGDNTFYFLAQRMGGSIDVSDMQFTVVFFPTSYGTVTPTVLARTGGGDASAPLMLPMSPTEIRTEQLQAVAFDRNRHETELGEVLATMRGMQSQIDELKRRFDEPTPPTASLPPNSQGVGDGTEPGHNVTRPK